MKLDSKTIQIGSPITRRLMYVGLGSIAFFCLMFAFSSNKKETPTKAPDALAIAIPTASAAEAEKSQNKDKDPNLSTATVAKVTPPEEPKEVWQSVKIRQGDTLSKIFHRLGISTKDLQALLHSDKSAQHLASLQPGRTLKLKLDEEGTQIDGITLNIAPGKTLNVLRTEEGFQFKHKEQPIENRLAFKRAEIRDSLASSAKRAGLDKKVVSQMVEIFGGKIDFSLDLRPRDTFRVLYEEKYLVDDDEKVETGNILAIELVNQGEKYQAIRYTDKSGRTGYFSPDGYGINQAFLRSPVNFASVSSHFGKRVHPVCHKMRNHKGVDYRAPHGTPVHATGDAIVVFVGKRGGYGNTVELQHGRRYKTLYAHLSRFATKMRVGARIDKGQVIGYVGRTGLATGDHLHYEFLIDGIHRDPLTAALPPQNSISDSNRRHFLAHAKEMLRLLDMHQNMSVKVARNEYGHNNTHTNAQIID